MSEEDKYNETGPVSLRDTFARDALRETMRKYTIDAATASWAAAVAYSVADAMIAERERKKNP